MSFNETARNIDTTMFLAVFKRKRNTRRRLYKKRLINQQKKLAFFLISMYTIKSVAGDKYVHMRYPLKRKQG